MFLEVTPPESWGSTMTPAFSQIRGQRAVSGASSPKPITLLASLSWLCLPALAALAQLSHFQSPVHFHSILYSRGSVHPPYTVYPLYSLYPLYVVYPSYTNSTDATGLLGGLPGQVSPPPE